MSNIRYDFHQAYEGPQHPSPLLVSGLSERAREAEHLQAAAQNRPSQMTGSDLAMHLADLRQQQREGWDKSAEIEALIQAYEGDK